MKIFYQHNFKGQTMTNEYAFTRSGQTTEQRILELETAISLLEEKIETEVIPPENLSNALEIQENMIQAIMILKGE